MSTCNFSIPFTGEAEVILAKAKTLIEGQQGVFTGDNKSGSFEITVLANTVRGTYAVEGQVLNLTITHKPFLIPCSTIESFLKSKIS